MHRIVSIASLILLLTNCLLSADEPDSSSGNDTVLENSNQTEFSIQHTTEFPSENQTVTSARNTTVHVPYYPIGEIERNVIIATVLLLVAAIITCLINCYCCCSKEVDEHKGQKEGKDGKKDQNSGDRNSRANS